MSTDFNKFARRCLHQCNDFVVIELGELANGNIIHLSDLNIVFAADVDDSVAFNFIGFGNTRRTRMLYILVNVSKSCKSVSFFSIAQSYQCRTEWTIKPDEATISFAPMADTAGPYISILPLLLSPPPLGRSQYHLSVSVQLSVHPRFTLYRVIATRYRLVTTISQKIIPNRIDAEKLLPVNCAHK